MSSAIFLNTFLARNSGVLDRIPQLFNTWNIFSDLITILINILLVSRSNGHEVCKKLHKKSINKISGVNNVIKRNITNFCYIIDCIKSNCITYIYICFQYIHRTQYVETIRSLKYLYVIKRTNWKEIDLKIEQKLYEKGKTEKSKLFSTR